jgi:glycerol-3-phosphate dehydrogenase (NAD(P)+)
MTSSFAVLGDGAWGTAIALLLAQNPVHRVTLWSAQEANGRLLQQHRENIHLLPGISIPDSVHLTRDVAEAVQGARLWVAAIPTIYLRPTLERVRAAVPPGPPILSLVKGVENTTFARPSEILTDVLGVKQVAVLSGPSHAEEVARGQPTSVVVASPDLDLACWIQGAFSTERFRVYTDTDLVGVELGGALKNIIGLAAGISDGLGFGDNTRSALMTRGLVEMTRFGVALGAVPETFTGLAGLGDLVTTCVSRHGRNRHVGERLGRGERLADILGSMAMVAEGVYTTRSVHERALQLGLDMPITTEVFRVLYEDKPPRAAVTDLMMRRPRGEKSTWQP